MNNFSLFKCIFWMLLIQYGLIFIGGDGFNIFDKILIVYILFKSIPYWNYIGKLYKISFFIFIFIGVLSNIVYKIQVLPGVINDLFLYMKFPIALFGGYLYGANNYDLSVEYDYIKKYCPIIAKSLAVVLFSNLFLGILPEFYGHLGPIKTQMLFFGHPTFMAATLFFYLSLYLFVNDKNKEDYIVISLFVIMIFLTLRMKAIGTLMVLLYFLYKQIRNKEITLKIREILVISFFCIILAWDKFVFYFVDNANYARGLILFNAIQIANEYFPIGAGFGSFASSGSMKYLSPLYEQYEMYNPDDFFANDSFIATVLSQTGYLGLIVYFTLIFLLIIKVMKISDSNRLLSVLVLLVYILICCIGEVSFFAVYIVPMAFWIGLQLGQEYNSKI